MSEHTIPFKLLPQWDWGITQQKDYHCGPASLLTIHNLFYPVDLNLYAKFVDELKPSEEFGTPNKVLVDAAQKYFKDTFISVGENTYQDGVAIANIFDRLDADPHYVVFLKKLDNQDIVYFDPYDGSIVITPLKNVQWESGEGYKNWSINFKSPTTLNQIVSDILAVAQKSKKTG